MIVGAYGHQKVAMSKEQPAERTWPDGDAELTTFLPLVYVAWSDGHLEAAEIALLRERVGALQGVRRPDQSGPRAVARSRRSPVGLRIGGVALATHGSRGPPRDLETRPPPTPCPTLGIASGRRPESVTNFRESLVELEDLLGVAGIEAVHALHAHESVRPRASEDRGDIPPVGSSDRRRPRAFFARCARTG